jgi:dTDP-4-amino-4,6-dideoxygalactose transaminase
MKSLKDYSDPFDAIKDFERLLCEFTGAPYAIVTDCCTHALEISLRLEPPNRTVRMPCRTYLSVVMLMHKLGINYELIDRDWFPMYNLCGTRVWDCARYFEKNMYQSGAIQCLSFNRGKPLAIGTGGAILTDDPEIAHKAHRMRYDGRDIYKYSPWITQQEFAVGYHYYLPPEDCVAGINLLQEGKLTPQLPEHYNYPDCRSIRIVQS